MFDHNNYNIQPHYIRIPIAYVTCMLRYKLNTNNIVNLINFDLNIEITYIIYVYRITTKQYTYNNLKNN